MTDDNVNKLLSIIEQNHIGHFKFLPQNLGFRVYEISGVAIINCGLGTSMFNMAYGSPKSSEIIYEIKQEFSGQPFAWWIPPSQHNPEVTKALLENDFIIENIEHAMICDLNKISNFTQKTNLTIKYVEDGSLLKDFISILEFYDIHTKEFYEKISNKLLQSQEKLFVGYISNKPISIGILFNDKKNGGIFSLITEEDERGKGYGTDMMLHLMKMAKDSGCDSVSLSASSDSGYKIYKRLGFSKLGEFECFEYKISE